MTTLTEQEATKLLQDMQTVYGMIDQGPKDDEFSADQFAAQFGITRKKAEYELDKLCKAGKITKRLTGRKVYFTLPKS